MGDRREAGQHASPASVVRVAILADDLIWASRLADAVSASGAAATRLRRTDDLRLAVEDGTRHVIIDLTARAYDGVEAVRFAAGAGARVLAVGQHDDLDLRKKAIAAGAEKVLAYRKLFEDGRATIERWLATPSQRRGSDAVVGSRPPASARTVDEDGA